MRYEKPAIQSPAHRIAFLDGLRGVAIAMVVATHAMAYAGVDDSIVAFLSFWVQSIAVPPFFLVDGFPTYSKPPRNMMYKILKDIQGTSSRLALRAQ